MTEPSGFEYRDDSIVARISVDVPSQTLTDLDQVRERASALRTELESIARATGDWTSYMQQIPQISEQANQSYRNMITSLERMSYIQQEMGGSQANIGMSGAPMAQGGGAAPYSTAAPAGYMDPFMGLPGQGMGMGMQGAQSYMQSMMMNDPRMFANMAAQRGYPVNPAQMGLVGGVVAAQQGAAPHTGGGMGQGAPTPGAMTPQPTQASRNSASAPNPNEGGAPSNSEHQREPATPHPDTPAWQRTLDTIAGTAGSVLNETRAGISGQNGRGGGLIAGGAAALGAIGRIGGGGGGGGDDGSGGGGGGGGGNWGRIAAGAGIAATGVGLGLKGFNMVQNAGEQIQQYSNLGAESGGGAVEGAGFEMQARMMSMNPFITLDQSRSIMQSALKNGYTGKEFDTVSQMMAENLKEMNMSSTQSMELFQSIVEKGKGSIEDYSKAMSDQKDLTAIDGNKMGLTQRNDQFSALTKQFADAGVGAEMNTKMSQSINEAFSDSQVLKSAVPAGVSAAMQNDNFLGAMMMETGISGVTDLSELPERMEEQGIDGGEAIEKTLRRIAKQATGASKDKTTAVSRFRTILGQYGMNLSRREAAELYDRMTDGSNPFTTGADQKIGAMNAEKGTRMEQASSLLLDPFKTAGNVINAGIQYAIGDTDNAKDSWAAAGRNQDNLGRTLGAGPDIETGANDRAQARANNKGTGPNMITPGTGGTGGVSEGRVNGEVRITIDQQGRVSAPQSVSLTGTQRQVNSGYGSGTLNNPGPGDMHQGTGWGGGG